MDGLITFQTFRIRCTGSRTHSHLDWLANCPKITISVLIKFGKLRNSNFVSDAIGRLEESKKREKKSGRFSEKRDEMRDPWIEEENCRDYVDGDVKNKGSSTYGYIVI